MHRARPANAGQRQTSVCFLWPSGWYSFGSEVGTCLHWPLPLARDYPVGTQVGVKLGGGRQVVAANDFPVGHRQSDLYQVKTVQSKGTGNAVMDLCTDVDFFLS